jgi:hypothetical protein
MKITVNQLRRIIKEEVRKLHRESTRDPQNLIMGLEGMSVGDTLDLEIDTGTGVKYATIYKEPTFEMGRVGATGLVYVITYHDDDDDGSTEFADPSELVNYFKSEGWLVRVM